MLQGIISFMRQVIVATVLFAFLFFVNRVDAYVNCPLFSSYDSFTDQCKCNYGYVSSGGRCISEDTYCQNLYGYNARSSYSGECECAYGYVLSGGSCISKTKYCQNLYGYNATSGLGTNNCECNYGYVLDGSSQCVYGNTYCSQKFGLHANYDSSSKSCKCDYGHVWNKTMTKCISEDEYCKDKHGFNAVSSLDKCECSYGYLFDSNLQCVNGNTFCSQKFGYDSEYDPSSKSCDCRSGYVLNKMGNKCISEDDRCIESFGEGIESTGSSSCDCKSGYLWNDEETECIDAELFCDEKLGENSEYDESNKECVCEDGFLLNSEESACVSEEDYCADNLGDNSEYDGGGECVCIDGFEYNNGECREKTVLKKSAEVVGSGVSSLFKIGVALVILFGLVKFALLLMVKVRISFGKVVGVTKKVAKKISRQKKKSELDGR